ncbi:mitochondrial carrier [Aspergillus uvarum CBS 121591]|uniref:Mitochondrial carrier n=1 Tax=Aspergillus uvarum CBS 121591 TaxID=1448315 RepID=A0A319D223_9EURO|nr:mitochondrial carrier [Aspergillus uvarum CBS 121591]PYH81948.1 mitochondrial carrier [Aspergillus uvarum CBS 121591]
MPNTNSDIWLSGAFAVVITDFMVYPFDTLKTRLQSPNYATVYKDATTGQIKRGVLFKGLYQGVGSVVLATIPASGAFFTTYEASKQALTRLFSPNQPQKPLLPTPLLHSMASCTAEAVSCFILTPAEVLKQNAQIVNSSAPTTTTNPNPNPTHPKNITLTILRRFRHRPWKLWSGYTALLGRNLPFTGIQFPIFEFVKAKVVGYRDTIPKKDAKGEIVERVYVTGIAGSVAGTISSVVTTPIDVVKTRMMLAATDTVEGDSVKRKRSGALAVGKEVYGKEGVKGLFRGGALRAFWTAISFGIYLSMYEGGKVYLGNRRVEREEKVRRDEEGAPL